MLGQHLRALRGNGVAAGTSRVPQVLHLADQVQHKVAASQVLPGVPGVQGHRPATGGALQASG